MNASEMFQSFKELALLYSEAAKRLFLGGCLQDFDFWLENQNANILILNARILIENASMLNS